MTRRLTLPGAAIVLAALALGPSTRLDAARQAAEQHVYVSVTTRDQAPIEGLAAGDFVVREDGVAREVLRVTPAPPPTHVALLADDTESAQSVITDIRQGLTAFVKTMAMADPTPAQALVTFGDRPTRAVAYALDTSALMQGINRLFSKPGSGSQFLDAVIEEAAELRRQQAARPVLVAVVVESGPEFSTALHQRVEDALKTAGASLWTIAFTPGGQPLATPEGRERAQVLTDVARRSGGDARNVLSRQAISQALARTATQILARYDVVYSRPDRMIPPEKLQVEVKRDGARVVAPAWTGGR
ncbi:MAG: hypothetical protein R2752_11280 [Vicinamibacterales bacterium]